MTARTERFDTLTTATWRPAWDAFVDALTFDVERVERPRADWASPNARRRNGWRDQPGVRVEWHVKVRDPEPALAFAVKYNGSSMHSTRKAAVAAVEQVREAVRKTWPNIGSWIDELWETDLPDRVLGGETQ